MDNEFQPGRHAALIGSLPMKDHKAATQLVMEYVPEIPLWVQLPAFAQEGMLAQFLPGFPGLTRKAGKTFIDTESETFETEVITFYEEYLTAAEDGSSLLTSRFALGKDEAAGFHEFMDQAAARSDTLVATKGQITGPFTFATGVVDANDRAVFYNDQLRDIAVKLIAMKARWQARRLAELGKPVIIFFDEPGLTAFGSSAFISISKEDVAVCFDEVVEAVHAEGGLTGIHVCANAEWSLILESAADIVSFDAYSFFDKFVLYPEQIKKFMDLGNILAWGIVPTSDKDDINNETVDSLAARWESQAQQLEGLGINRQTIDAQSLITPSCGTGSLDLETATRVLELTRGLSKQLRLR
ncbi:MAG: hypothetical protein SWH61_11230 [Thermodesulfobacteriota bacterium]|nr:hypothetical protein [Thermodesulfobacteriota bacterium]